MVTTWGLLTPAPTGMFKAQVFRQLENQISCAIMGILSSTNLPYNEMKRKQNSFRTVSSRKTVSKLFWPNTLKTVPKPFFFQLHFAVQHLLYLNAHIARIL